MLIENLDFSYSNCMVFENFNLHIDDCAITAIMGSSGCGKTTLLNLICGKLKPDGGRIFLSDKKSDDKKIRIGYCFSKLVFLPYFSILKNLKIFCFQASCELILQMLDELELSDMRNKKPNELSLGQLQRVNIIRSFASSPDIVLLDEPTGHLDLRLVKKADDFILKYSKDKTIIAVTHNMAEANSISRKLVDL